MSEPAAAGEPAAISSFNSSRNWPWLALSIALLVWDPHATAQAPKALAVCVLALLAAAWVAFRKAPIVLSAPLAGAGLWVSWTCLTLLWGSPSALAAQGFAVAALVISLSARATWSLSVLREQLRKLAVILGVSCAGWALYQYASGARGNYVHGGMGNPNWLGLLLALTLVLSVPQRSRLKQVRGRLLLVLTLSPQLVALYLAHSRVAWVALVVAAVFAALRLGVARFRQAAPHLAWVAAIAAPLAAWGATPSSAEGWQGALAGRRFLWRAALEVISLHPTSALTGFGSGRFTGAFLEGQGALLSALSERSAARAFQAINSAHSDWLQALVEHGFGGWLLLSAWFWLALRPKPASQSWIRGEIALVTLMVCAIADAPLRQPPILVLALLTTAALGGNGLGHFASCLPRPLRRFPVWWLALGVLAVSTRANAGHWLGERAIASAREQPGVRQVALARAVSLDPYSAQAHFELAVALLDAGQADLSLQHAARSIELSPSLGAELVRAKALSRQGKLPRARSALLNARRLSPGSFRVNLGLASLELELGELGAAEASLGRASSVLPGDPRLEPLRHSLERAQRERELR